MLRRLSLILCLAFALPAFAADPPPPPFVEVPDFKLPPPPADKAQIVFLEPINKIQGLFPMGIFRIEPDKQELIAVSSWRSKTVAYLEPGKHLLMNIAGNHVMEANVEAGKRYYVLLRFIYANGMQLRPIRPHGTSEYRMTSKDFPKWLKVTSRFVEKSPTAESFWKPEFVEQARNAAIEKWQSKSAAEAAELTLTIEDAAPL